MSDENDQLQDPEPRRPEVEPAPPPATFDRCEGEGCSTYVQPGTQLCSICSTGLGRGRAWST